MKLGHVLLLGMLAVCSSASAQDRWNIAIDAHAEDSVGQRLVTGLRDKLAASPRYTLGNSEDSFFSMNISTLDPSINHETGLSTVYAITLTLKNVNLRSLPLYLGQTVGICPSDNVPECVDDIYSGMDTSFSHFAQSGEQRRAEPTVTNRKRRSNM